MSGLEALVDFLQARHKEIATIEQEAHAALYDRHDEAAYRDLMQKRALAIVALGDFDEEAEALFANAPRRAADLVRAKLSRFASGARMSLEIGSVFYMSALLYPDEHQQGEPDNLERLVLEVRNIPE